MKPTKKVKPQTPKEIQAAILSSQNTAQAELHEEALRTAYAHGWSDCAAKSELDLEAEKAEQLKSEAAPAARGWWASLFE